MNIMNLFVCLMVFNATFNNISVISCQSVLLMEETGEPGENHDLSQVTDKPYHIMFYTSPWSSFELTTSVVVGTDCIYSCKCNYHAITAMTAPVYLMGGRYILMTTCQTTTDSTQLISKRYCRCVMSHLQCYTYVLVIIQYNLCNPTPEYSDIL